MFEVRIVIESKNYTEAVGIELVDAFKAKIEEIGAELGVMVCPAGFTGPAKKRAAGDRIQLFEVYDPTLGNSDLFIPLRYVEPAIERFSYEISGRTRGPFSIPSDMGRWRFEVDGRVWTPRDLVTHAWNKGLVPQQAGQHVADFGAVTIMDSEAPDDIQYCELKIHIEVIDTFCLKLLPASWWRSVADGKENFNLKIDLYSKEEDMIRHGWRKFESLEEMNRAADIENQPVGIRGILFRPKYTYRMEETEGSPQQ